MGYRQDKKRLLEDWQEEKLELADDMIVNAAQIRTRVFKKGEIVLVKFGENLGSEQNSSLDKERPAVVLSNEKVNSGVLVVAPLTSKRMDRIYRTEVSLSKAKYQFLTNDSKVLTDQIRIISAVRATKKIGYLSIEDCNRIDMCLVYLLELDYLVQNV